MSDAFAIAAVTAALKARLGSAVAVAGLDTALGGTPHVSALPPDRVNPTNGADPNQLNLFLYSVTPNPGWSNVQLPSRDSSGDRTANPPLALDLHYLLTAYAAGDLGAEMLLGHGMQALHEVPFFTRQWLKDTLKQNGGDEIPAVLETTGIAEQVEQIRIAPKPLTVDDLSKLWTALQGRYRPTAAYVVTVVLIEGRRAARASLPVLERNIPVVPWSAIRVDDAINAAGDTLPIAAGVTLRLRGAGLAANGLQVWLGGVDLTSAVTKRTDTELDVALSDPLPAGLRAGLIPIQLVQPVVGSFSFSSNAVGVLLRPTLGAPALNADSITVPVAPPVTARQRVLLLLNERQPPANRRAFAFSFPAPLNNGIVSPATETSSLSFAISGVSPATYVVRVQVDGAESLLAVDPQGRFDKPSLAIP